MAGRQQTTASQRLANAAKRFKQAVARNQWKATHQGKPPPGPRELIRVCQDLVANPHKIGGAWDWEIRHALQGFLAKTPLRRPNSKEVAEWVDLFVEDGLSLAEARKEAAGFLKKSVEAVKQAHLRHGRKKRDKSR
jgi:hypothetical protein